MEPTGPDTLVYGSINSKGSSADPPTMAPSSGETMVLDFDLSNALLSILRLVRGSTLAIVL